MLPADAPLRGGASGNLGGSLADVELGGVLGSRVPFSACYSFVRAYHYS